MAKSPKSIIRTMQIEKIEKCQSCVSTTFIATFEDGTQKFLNDKKWTDNSLIKQHELSYMVMPFNECTLYFMDWAKMPNFATQQDRHLLTSNIQL